MNSVDYKLPQNGLGSDFSQYERPLTFAEIYTNRFRNITGGAERRPGMQRISDSISGSPNLTRMHEWVSNQGDETLLASDDFGTIWSFDGSATWTKAITGKSFVRQLSGQSGDKLIFVNGVDRNFYTDNGGQTFNELKAIITRGVTAGSTTTTNLVDSDVTNWTGLANNDIVYNVTKNGYGIVVTIASAALTMTAIAAAGNGAGRTAVDQGPGDQYQIIDYVDLNILPQANGLSDNIGILTTGTTTTVIAVSGVDFSTTQIRTGDFVYNTTRGAISIIGSVSAMANLTAAITGQIAGDSIALFKSAMPIASWVHIHYGRCYYLDSRDQRRVVISAPDDPQDVTTFAQTLDSSSFQFGTQQPTGDVILTMTTFQGYFVAGGQKNLFIYKGNTPIKDSSTSTLDFEPIAFYPNGVYSRFGLGTNGSDLLHITTEGLQAINIGNISNTTIQNNVSNPIRSELLNAIESSTANNVQFTHYPRRAWLLVKVSDSVYVLNTNPSYTDFGELQPVSSWHLFAGKWAQQNHYFVRRNGDLLACGLGGLVYRMDASAATDDGVAIATDMVTAWLRLEEPQQTVRIKQGQYIKPVFESSPNVQYTINVVAGFDGYSSDSITVSAGGNGQIGTAVIGTGAIGGGGYAQSNKHPFRWRGEQARIEFITESSATPDVITGFTLYGNITGIR